MQSWIRGEEGGGGDGVCYEEVTGDEVGEDFLAVRGGRGVGGTESEGVCEVGFCL